MGRLPVNLVGKKFGRLKVISYYGLNQNNEHIWICICDCLKNKIATSRCLSQNLTKSCGCLHKDKSGNNKNKNYIPIKTERRAYYSMKSRCLNKNHKQYDDYGGRGITVCEEWIKSFNNFIKDMGYKPNPNYSLGRIDNDGPYSKYNCRWENSSQQNSNRRPLVKTIMRTSKRYKNDELIKYYGVFFVRRLQKYIAIIMFNNKKKQIGTFTDPKSAAIAYNDFIIKNNLQNFRLNIIY
jgi:hypothetical protein